MNTPQIVRLDPSSLLGYERKHAALHGIGHYDDAVDAFDTMLLKMSQSSDPEIQGKGEHHPDISLLKFSHRTSSSLRQATTDKGNNPLNCSGYHS